MNSIRFHKDHKDVNTANIVWLTYSHFCNIYYYLTQNVIKPITQKLHPKTLPNRRDIIHFLHHSLKRQKTGYYISLNIVSLIINNTLLEIIKHKLCMPNLRAIFDTLSDNSFELKLGGFKLTKRAGRPSSLGDIVAYLFMRCAKIQNKWLFL